VFLLSRTSGNNRCQISREVELHNRWAGPHRKWVELPNRYHNNGNSPVVMELFVIVLTRQVSSSVFCNHILTLGACTASVFVFVLVAIRSLYEAAKKHATDKNN
jgi:hypothetical protein